MYAGGIWIVPTCPPTQSRAGSVAAGGRGFLLPRLGAGLLLQPVSPWRLFRQTHCCPLSVRHIVVERIVLVIGLNRVEGEFYEVISA